MRGAEKGRRSAGYQVKEREWERDIRSAEQTVLHLSREQTKQGTLILVNRKNPITHRILAEQMTDFPEAKEPLPQGGFRPISLERETARMLRLAFQSLSLSGKIVMVSGYRRAEEQQELYEKSLRENGEVFTRSYVAYPSCSEHETGLAVDLGEFQEEIDYIRPAFPYTGICQEFREKAAVYGFVERYEKEKKKITGISAEPWHFRYVGTPHARIMKANGMCLEEYLTFLENFPEGGRMLVWREEGWQFHITCQKVLEEEIDLKVPKDWLYQISGDNRGGFIKTIWRRV